MKAARNPPKHGSHRPALSNATQGGRCSEISVEWTQSSAKRGLRFTEYLVSTELLFSMTFRLHYLISYSSDREWHYLHFKNKNSENLGLSNLLTSDWWNWI